MLPVLRALRRRPARDVSCLSAAGLGDPPSPRYRKRSLMSYDVICYRPTRDKPSAADAVAVVDAEENGLADGEPRARKKPSAQQESVARALLVFDPSLSRFVPKRGGEQGSIELNTPEDVDPALQIGIYPDTVCICVPDGYGPKEAEAAFERLHAYARVVHETCGFFVWDPQLGLPHDPSEGPSEALSVYVEMDL